MINLTEEKVLEALMSSGYKFSNLDFLSIRQLSNKSQLSYSDTHKVVKKLEKLGIIKLIELANSKAPMFNYCKTIVGSYIENIKTNIFLENFRKINHFLRLFEENKLISYTLIIFGSYAKGTQRKDSDIDIMFLSEDKNLEDVENIFINVKKHSTLKFDANFFSYGEFMSMLKEIPKINVATELYKNHIILTGYENYIKCIGKIQNE